MFRRLTVKSKSSRKIEEKFQEELIFDPPIDREEEDKPKKRKKYVTQKSVKLDNLLEAAKDYKFNYKPISINLVKDVEETKKLTNGTCLRPDIHLDNDYYCDKCYIFNNCVCSIKGLKKFLELKTMRDYGVQQ